MSSDALALNLAQMVAGDRRQLEDLRKSLTILRIADVSPMNDARLLAFAAESRAFASSLGRYSSSGPAGTAVEEMRVELRNLLVDAVQRVSGKSLIRLHESAAIASMTRLTGLEKVAAETDWFEHIAEYFEQAKLLQNTARTMSSSPHAAFASRAAPQFGSAALFAAILALAALARAAQLLALRK